MCKLFSARRVGVLAAFILLFICPLRASSQTNQFILLGDIHYDLLEDHDFEWLATNSPASILAISNLCAITEANWDDFMTHLQGVIETNAPSVKAVIQLGDLSNGLAGGSKADQMAASVMEAVEQSGLGVPWILTKGNHEVTFAPDAEIAFNNHYLPMIREQTGNNSIQMANYSYRSGSVEVFVCDYYERSSVDPIAWLDAAAQASTAPVKFAVFHEPIIPVTERCWHMYRGTNTTDVLDRQRLLQVMATNKLIALVGHLHRYSIVSRNTQWGPIVQIMAASVIKDRNVVSTEDVITQYGPSIATDVPLYLPGTLEEREEILAEEQPDVRFYKQCSLQGFGVLNVDETTTNVVLNYYGGFSTEPFDTIDITALTTPIVIPNVVGLSRPVAETSITNLDLIVGAETNEYSSTVPAGDVIRQTPDGNSIDILNTPVYLVISLGTQGFLPNISDISVVDGSDDAEQKLADGTVNTGSSDLEIVDDNFDFGMQTVGVRFQNIPLASDTSISNAYIQFTADQTPGDSNAVMFTIRGEAADHSSAFTTAAYNISSRTQTTTSVSWSPAAWTAGVSGAAEQTADITSILNEIIARPGWSANNAISLIITGSSGTRRAESYNGSAAKAPVLHIEHDGGVVNNDIRFSSTIVKGPYPLYKNSPNTMQIIWQAAGATGGTIQWGSTSTYGQLDFPVSLGNNMYAYTITGLQADQKVYYRVDVAGDYSSSFFYTAPDATATNVTLYAAGDCRSVPANQNSCFGAMLADINGNETSRNTLLLHSGDVVETGGVENDWANDWFGRSYANSVEAQSRLPIAAGVGNHEIHSDPNCTNFRKYYPYDYEDDTGTGQNGCYYAYEYGPALILVIDLEQGCADGSAQYNWVVNELQNSTQPFKIAVYHEPAYSAGGSHADTETLMVQAREVLAPLFKTYDCLLAISGHNHYYNRSLVNGIHHITTGGLGAPLATPGTAVGQEKAEKVRHFLRIECDTSTRVASVTVIRENGTVLEAFDVQYPVTPDQTTTSWDPSDSNLWTDDANWTGGAAPLRTIQNLKVRFHLEGAVECVLNTNAVAAVLVVGSNGTTNGCFLKLVSGANLLCGDIPDGGTGWTAIGYNLPSTVTIESNAVFETAANLLLGYSGIGNSTLFLDGGTGIVATAVQMGNVENTSYGFVTVDNGGQLQANGLTFNNTNCVVDIHDGSVLLAGNQTNAVNGYIASGTLRGYGSTVTLNVDYDTSNTGKTTITATQQVVTVPNVTGQTQAVAESNITTALLTVGTKTDAYSTTVPIGNIISQSPVGESAVNLGTAVDLVISLGAQVPSVVGLTQAAAEAAIEAAGLVVGTGSTASSETVPASDVISQSPPSGSAATLGSSVYLVVSTGIPAQTITVWDPTVSALWTDDANWTGGAAPLRTNQNLKVRFYLDVQECVLNTNAVVAVLVVGSNGTTTNECLLKLASGANLLCGDLPDGGTGWTAIGYNRPAIVTVESNAVFETAANLLLGYSGIDDSMLFLDGGTASIATAVQLGNIADTSWGVVLVDHDGLLIADSLTFRNTNCVVDVCNGSVVLDGNQTNAANGYIANGTLLGYGGKGVLSVDYNTVNTNMTTITASNLVENSSFELGGSTPTSWTQVGGIANSTNSAQDGIWALKVTAASQNARQAVPIEVGKTYNLSAWINTEDLTATKVVFDTVDQYDGVGRGQFVVWPGNGGWTQYSGSFTATNTSVTLRFFTDGSTFSGTAYCDHIILTEAP